MPSIKAICANRLFPSFADWHLAKTGYDSQIPRGLRDRDEPDDLWRSAPGGFGAHRRFDAAAKSVSVQLWLTTHRAFPAMLILTLPPVLFAAVRWSP
jgi:hypothetical protein